MLVTMRWSIAALLLLPACAATQPSTTTSSSGEVKKPDPPPAVTCAEPTALAPVANVSDPESELAWRRGEDPSSIKDGAREYAITAEGAITAREAGKELWRVEAQPVAGGAFGLMLSPAGRVVVRQFSRGGLELFDVNDGRLLRKVGAAVPSPDDRFVLELPRVPFALEAWDHDDVRYVPLDPARPVQSIVKLPLKQGEHAEFGAAVCSTGTLIAVSFATTELAIYRTSDLQRLAAASSPGPGVPVFTRSGRYVVLREKDKPRAIFELVR